MAILNIEIKEVQNILNKKIEEINNESFEVPIETTFNKQIGRWIQLNPLKM